ncbi:MAG: two-component sensor histidine kinase [Rhodospirillaceae bacterium]|jgi:two-component system nitrogen regulation sensor histidine kinase GlnL|nr:two-component sensor histidine kinase [Rhodospirillaceae bacterium]
MARNLAPTIARESKSELDQGPMTILNALESAVALIAPNQEVEFVNSSAEQFFASSSAQLIGAKIYEILPPDSPLIALIQQVQTRGSSSVSEYGLTLNTPRIKKNLVNVQVTSIADKPGHAVLSIYERSIADKIDRQLTHRNAARSITAMSAMLAHEVKNPLSGIRGAAQLLEHESNAEDQKLTQLICDETDRICALVDRMEVFSDNRPLEREAVNIHKVLERVRQLAQNGFARNLKIVENYDPSLPPVDGNNDQLVQIFLNLVKNAAEAIVESNGEIVLSTAYQHSVRFAVPGSNSRTHLPLVISVQDNGDGIRDDLQDHLFDAFVTSKQKGSGLGLALVAKMVDDHGGVIEFDSRPGKTVFQVMLPMAASKSGSGQGSER